MCSYRYFARKCEHIHIDGISNNPNHTKNTAINDNAKIKPNNKYKVLMKGSVPSMVTT